MNSNQDLQPQDVRSPMSQESHVSYETDTDVDSDEEVLGHQAPQHAQQPAAQAVPGDDTAWWNTAAQQPDTHAAGQPVQGQTYPFSPFSDDSGNVNPTYIHQPPTGNVAHGAGLQPVPQQASFPIPQPLPMSNPSQRPRYLSQQPQPRVQAPCQPVPPAQQGFPGHQVPYQPSPIPQRVSVGANVPKANVPFSQQPRYASYEPLSQRQPSYRPPIDPFANSMPSRSTSQRTSTSQPQYAAQQPVPQQQPSYRPQNDPFANPMPSRSATPRINTTQQGTRQDLPLRQESLLSKELRKDTDQALLDEGLRRSKADTHDRTRNANAGEGPSNSRRHEPRHSRDEQTELRRATEQSLLDEAIRRSRADNHDRALVANADEGPSHRHRHEHRRSCCGHSPSPPPRRPRRKHRHYHSGGTRGPSPFWESDVEPHGARVLRISAQRGFRAAIIATFRQPPSREEFLSGRSDVTPAAHVSSYRPAERGERGRDSAYRADPDGNFPSARASGYRRDEPPSRGAVTLRRILGLPELERRESERSRDGHSHSPRRRDAPAARPSHRSHWPAQGHRRTDERVARHEREEDEWRDRGRSRSSSRERCGRCGGIKRHRRCSR